jgi:hypothetical protein
MMNNDLENSIYSKNAQFIKNYEKWALTIANCICNIGKTFNNQSESKLGLKKLVFLDILTRINFNLYGLIPLFREFKTNPDMRVSINLLFRGCLVDVLTGMYLAYFAIDEESLKNELIVLDLDYAGFSKYIIENEEYILKTKTDEEIEQLKIIKIKDFVKRHPELFINEKDWKCKTPSEIRKTSKRDLFFIDNHFNNKINEPLKDKLFSELSSLKPYRTAYILYRYYSQYQHYTFGCRDTLQLPIEYDLHKYYLSFIMINESVQDFCKLLEIEDELLKPLGAIADEYMNIEGFKKK